MENNSRADFILPRSEALVESLADLEYHWNDKNAIVMITHYQRLLNYIKPDYVHVMMAGKLIKSGGFELAEELEANGYDALEKELVLNGEAQ